MNTAAGVVMTQERRSPLPSAALAGVTTALGFAALHQLLISNIWFSIVPMMIAGAVCSVSLVWSYRILVRATSAASWFLYNLAWVALFMLLGVVSLLVFEPMATIQELITANEPPRALIARAMPLTVAFTMAAAAASMLPRSRSTARFLAALANAAVLIVILGLNISVLGLVELTLDALPLIALLFALVAAILIGNAAAVLLLERNRLFARDR